MSKRHDALASAELTLMRLESQVSDLQSTAYALSAEFGDAEREAKHSTDCDHYCADAGIKNPAALPALIGLLPDFIFYAAEAHEAGAYILGYDPTAVHEALAAATGEPNHDE